LKTSGQINVPAALTPEQNPDPIEEEIRCAQEPVKAALVKKKILPLPGIGPRSVQTIKNYKLNNKIPTFPQI
jgi:hypothetical protein